MMDKSKPCGHLLPCNCRLAEVKDADLGVEKMVADGFASLDPIPEERSAVEYERQKQRFLYETALEFPGEKPTPEQLAAAHAELTGGQVPKPTTWKEELRRGVELFNDAGTTKATITITAVTEECGHRGSCDCPPEHETLARRDALIAALRADIEPVYDRITAQEIDNTDMIIGVLTTTLISRGWTRPISVSGDGA